MYLQQYISLQYMVCCTAAHGAQHCFQNMHECLLAAVSVLSALAMLARKATSSTTRCSFQCHPNSTLFELSHSFGWTYRISNYILFSCCLQGNEQHHEPVNVSVAANATVIDLKDRIYHTPLHGQAYVVRFS